jgi:type IV pilus assembly protein PilW
MMNKNSVTVSRQNGMTLIEMMIGLVLGLFLVWGLMNIYLSQRLAYRMNDNLALMQDNTRISFELMARELREAGGNPCGVPFIFNSLNGASSSAWFNWEDGAIHGYSGTQEFPPKAFGSAAGDRVAGTDAVIIRTASMGDSLKITQHIPASAQFKVHTEKHGIQDGDILLVCDDKQGAILQATNVNASNKTIVHNTGTGAPGNCSKELTWRSVCSETSPDPKEWKEFTDGFISKLSATAWYIGHNDRGGRSLYRVVGGVAPVVQEIAEGAVDMRLNFLTKTGTVPAINYVEPHVVTNWTDGDPKVTAVRVEVDLESRDKVTHEGNTLERQLVHVVTLRHRDRVKND